MSYWHLRQEFNVNEFLHKSDYIYILETVNIWSILFKNLNGMLLVVVLIIVNIISGIEN